LKVTQRALKGFVAGRAPVRQRRTHRWRRRADTLLPCTELPESWLLL